MRVPTVNRRLAPARLAMVAGGAAGVALLAAACSSGGSSSSSAPAAAASSPAGGSAAASGASGAAGAAVIGTASSSAGTVLTDGAGRAVYLWVKDTGTTSVCSGACAGAWPPVTTTGAPTSSGAAKSGDLGTTKRSDGTMQVTYNGHPLYYYAGDSASGMATGQGSDGFGAKWWLLAPSGSDVTAAVTSFTVSGGSGASAPAAPPASNNGGGYGY